MLRRGIEPRPTVSKTVMRSSTPAERLTNREESIEKKADRSRNIEPANGFRFSTLYFLSPTALGGYAAGAQGESNPPP